jgi:SAM-dependent methyltransferase
MLMRRTNTDRLRWYHLVYRLFYRVGLIVWEREDPPSELIMLIEGSSALPPGRALDLGCGTGTDTIYMAAHGWEVTGVDMVTKALVTARRRAAAAGVSARFVNGDVTRLQDLGLGGDHTLVLDFGCYHTLPEDQRSAYVNSVSSATPQGGTLLLYGFARPPRAPMHAGVTVDEVRDRFGRHGWNLVDAGRASVNTIRVRGRATDERFELWHFRMEHAQSLEHAQSS